MTVPVIHFATQPKAFRFHRGSSFRILLIGFSL
jgi:hypothetical protein